ncbi:helix-turn-helix domain-containing protein [Desulfoplanes formicivorans]|uniref:DNA-binding protein n=1 Tax=Desulfoplanes formicivorans TaxID=1592317 RepID=A0A194AJ95_9BACT|nr:XRE family transcriptional regulator [Desulfoplanes formicivorans]GAU09393.1 DNA-binding protein [Desulfoplanes formicivorans]
MEEATPIYKEIAPRLRGLRDAMELSTEAMAGDLGVGVDEVETYESGEVEIPVSYLFRVAQAYHVDLTVLISGNEAHLHNYSMVKAGNGLSVERRKDYDYKSLAYRFVGRKMEPFYIKVPPKDVNSLNYSHHEGQEFIYMLKGKLEIHLGDKVFVMEPGDSFYFDSTTPHALRALGEANAEFLDVII